MSKQVNRVNIEPEILHGNWSFRRGYYCIILAPPRALYGEDTHIRCLTYTKYIEFFVNPFTSCKTDIIKCWPYLYNAGAG